MPVWPQVIERLRSEPGLKYVLDADGDGITAGSDGNFEQLTARESGAVLPEPAPDSIAAYFHTGGTTGAPKLAIHTHLNQAFVARAAAQMCDLRADDVMINGFPLFHVAGSFVYGLSVLSAGGELLVPGRLGMRNRSFVSSIWKRISDYGVTVVGAVPTIISAINELALDADISSLRVVLTGGSPLPGRTRRCAGKEDRQAGSQHSRDDGMRGRGDDRTAPWPAYRGLHRLAFAFHRREGFPVGSRQGVDCRAM